MYPYDSDISGEATDDGMIGEAEIIDKGFPFFGDLYHSIQVHHFYYIGTV